MKFIHGIVAYSKEWAQRQQSKGRWSRSLCSARYVLDLWRYRSTDRCLNYTLVAWKTASGAWEKLQTEGGGYQRIFYTYSIKGSDPRLIIKIPRADNSYSWRFTRSLRQERNGHAFKDTLRHVCLDKFLGPHCAPLLEAKADGRYVCEFVSGPNLYSLRQELFRTSVLPALERNNFIDALQTLIMDLSAYQRETGRLIGDWALQNLVYSRDRAAIVNVDLEGFFTFNSETPALESDLGYIEKLLSDVEALVRMRDSVVPTIEGAVRALELVDEVRKSEAAYSGGHFLVGYHSMRLGQHEFRGQRECNSRLENIPIDFRGKIVADFGCNSGGMLHGLAPVIQAGYGFDFNAKCVNAANAVKRVNGNGHLDFYQFDLDRDELSLIESHFIQGTPDVAFLLSVCMWLNRWQELVRHIASIVDTLIFESNGTQEQQAKQYALLLECFREVECLSDTSPDDQLQAERCLYLCTGSKLFSHDR